MKKYDDIVIIIPAFNPDQKLLQILQELQDAGFSDILLVDDGSTSGKEIFHRARESKKGGVHSYTET